MTDGYVRRAAGCEVPDVGDGLWERVRDAVMAECGADRCLWNGVVEYVEAGAEVAGVVGLDGSLRLHRDFVVEPLQEMYARWERSAGPDLWMERRAALLTVVHEFTHLVVPREHDGAPGVVSMLYWPLEEGVTEAWSHARLDRIAKRVLPPQLAAGIEGVGGWREYPDWEPAARAFADQIGAELGVDGDEVLCRMVRESSLTMARAVADLLFDHSALPAVMPPDQQGTMRWDIAAPINWGFQDLLSLNGSVHVTSRRAIARGSGLEIADAAVEIVRKAEFRLCVGPAVERPSSRTPSPGSQG
ncbi:hypothetical protein ABZX12_40850 [Kribbella sp. NPDC003505]|uniref:hypothetical protein n=1 Tax=Kribbella sp. NPDC003505 TaxID=3154448 RepID=UPI0033A1FD9D